jgi:peptide deformylase
MNAYRWSYSFSAHGHDGDLKYGVIILVENSQKDTETTKRSKGCLSIPCYKPNVIRSSVQSLQCYTAEWVSTEASLSVTVVDRMDRASI